MHERCNRLPNNRSVHVACNQHSAVRWGMVMMVDAIAVSVPMVNGDRGKGEGIGSEGGGGDGIIVVVVVVVVVSVVVAANFGEHGSPLAYPFFIASRVQKRRVYQLASTHEPACSTTDTCSSC